MWIKVDQNEQNSKRILKKNAQTFFIAQYMSLTGAVIGTPMVSSPEMNTGSFTVSMAVKAMKFPMKKII